MRLTVDLFIENGRIYLPIQSDVEDIALATLGTHHQIYSDPIPITDGIYLKFDRESGNGWEVLAKEESR